MRPEQIETTAAEFSRRERLERQILEIADHEKQHIGRELHDGLCQSLTGIAALCSVLSRSLAASGQSGPAAAASEIVGLLNNAIGEARDIAHGLSGIGLNGTDLVGELETLARIVRDTYFASCTFKWDRRCPRLGEETETHLLRIAQEAVRNAFTHGQANEVDISLERVDGFGRLSIWDNGVGFSEDDPNHHGIGFLTMDYRARAIGGSLTIARHPEGGTVVVCAFGLPQTHDSRDGPADALG